MAAGMEIKGQVEIDDYCQKILALRYPYSIKWKDIKSVKGEEIKEKCGAIDIITGGFPCQPFSNAGQKMGTSDDRHLWPEMFRVIQEVKPTWVVGENVSGFVDMALDDVCANLESAGYEVGTLIFSAHALGAWHRRERVWIVGYAEHARRHATQERRSLDQGNDHSTTGTKQASESKGPGNEYENVAYSESTRLQGRKEHEILQFSERVWWNWWKVEPSICRVVDGSPANIHRLKMLGNGQVPACTYVIGKMIMEIENDK